MANHQIICGDVVQALTELDDAMRFDVIIADPPYNIGFAFGENNRDDMPLDEYVAWCETWIRLCRERLTERGVAYIYGRPEILCHVVAHCRLLPDGHRWLQWHMTNRVNFGSKWWQRTHESIIAVWRPDSRQPPLQVDAIRVPISADAKTMNRRGRVGKIRRGRQAEVNDTTDPHRTTALPRDVITALAPAGLFGRREVWYWCDRCQHAYRHDQQNEHDDHIAETWKHPTVKPFAVTRQLIRSVIGNSSVGRVLIPFAGSGTECDVCYRANIEFVAIELERKYCDLIESRLAQTPKPFV